jgi:ribonuclease HI
VCAWLRELTLVGLCGGVFHPHQLMPLCSRLKILTQKGVVLNSMLESCEYHYQTPLHTILKWKINVLKELVDSNSLEAIEKIIIPLQPLQDKLIWTLDPCGIYTVKSAINCCLTPRTSYNPADSLWKQLWKLKMHERLKVFLWRMGSNALPTKQRVFQRTGYSDPMCPLCGVEEESYSHLFLHCQMIKPIWFGLNWGLHSDNIPAANHQELLNFVVNPPLCPGVSVQQKTLKAQTSIQLALTLESIWNLRNQVVHNNAQVNHLVIVKNLEERIIEHFNILNPATCCNTLLEVLPRWSAPPPNSVKFNVDAATSKNGFTIAAIARDDAGFVIHCWSKSFPTTDPLIAETTALLWALEIARDNCFSHILIEGDAKICIEALAEPEKVSWRIQTLVSNIKCVALDFNVCFFYWVPRDVNALAHSFAKFASSQDFCFSCNSTNLPPSVHEV